MRVCFLNRGRETMPGGDCVGLDATMDALRKRGIECEETGWDRQRMSTGRFDLAHIQHCNFSWSWGNYEAVRDVGLPYVLTPVYYPGQAKYSVEAPLLSGITLDQLKEIVNNAKIVLPFSRREARELHYATATWPSTWRYLPNATDPQFYGPDNRDHMSVLDVLAVSARGDSDKNITIVREVCERLGRTLTVATGLSRADLAAEYRCHRVFVNASSSERMSLTIGEALCAGCRVLATDQNWGNEWYESLVTFDPSNEIRLEHLIRWALSSPDWDYRPNAAARCLTWDWVAEKLEGVYKEVLAA